MRAMIFALGAFLVLGPGVANAAISCADIPKAQSFLDTLRPGPNTRAAQHHLDAAKSATSDRQCVAELHKVDYYAKRSAAADRRLGGTAQGTSTRPVLCADALHQDRPGGTDYHGPYVASCPAPTRGL